MTEGNLKLFMAAQGWNKVTTARELGITRETLDKYLAKGAPRTIGLACAALAAGLAEWQDPAGDN